jgi:osmotically-inducible protein OsmY
MTTDHIVGAQATTMSDDQLITQEIRAALERDPHVHNPSEVAVSESAGTVTLRGTVRSLHQRRMVVESVRSVRGVHGVEDDLRVDPRDHWPDEELRGIALQALIDDEAVPDERVDVSASAGWVTLKGAVKRQADSDAAFHAISALPGVGGITNRIDVVTAGIDG